MPPLLALATLIALAFPGSAPSPPQTPQLGVPVFDCYHVNHAWGFFLAGTVIDDRGQIFTYRTADKALEPTAVVEQGQVFYSDADLARKFENRTVAGHVEKSALDEKSTLVRRAATGSIVRQDTGVRDAGVGACHAYIHDRQQHRYRDVTLGSYGSINDQRVKNTAEAAQTLLAWLRSVRAAQ